MSAIPTLKEELDRKAFETFEWLFHSVDTGKMTTEQFSTGVDTLFKVVSGLVDDSMMELVTAADFEVRKHPRAQVKQVYVGSNWIYTAEWEVGTDSVIYVAYTSGQESNRRVIDYDTPKKALEGIKFWGDKLNKRGFVRI